ncbi:MAG: PQQ-binding-like beta-propeller repeat protein [Pirellulales bacterium]
MKTWCLLLIGVSLGIFSLAAVAADWPQWRGPLRNGISGETGLLREWPEGGPKLVWQVTQIGSGYSTPAVVGDRLYLLSNEGTDDEFVQALDAKDGSQVWSTRIGKVGNPDQNPPYPGARSTPTVDGKLMYALGSDGDLACLETSSGQIQWQENLRTQFGGQPGVWAYAESPLVDGEVLVCTPGGAEATMVALDKNTGDLIWKCAVPGGDQAGYASIVIVESGGVKQYVQFMQKGLVGVDAAGGEFLWRYDRTAEGSPANIPTPVARDGYVYSAAGRSGGGLVKLNVDQAKVEAQEVYFDPKLPTSLGGAVLVGDHLYGTTGQGLVCADFITGELKWQDRAIGPGSLCYADGRLYIHGENGDVALVEATPEAYRELGRLTLPDQPDRGRSRAWSHPVIANGRLIIRDLDTLWMYDIRGNR